MTGTLIVVRQEEHGQLEFGCRLPELLDHLYYGLDALEALDVSRDRDHHVVRSDNGQGRKLSQGWRRIYYHEVVPGEPFYGRAQPGYAHDHSNELRFQAG